GSDVCSSDLAETWVAALLFAAAGCGFGFVAIYIVLSTDTQLLGLAFGAMLALLAAAAILAGKLVVPQETSVEPRDELLVEPEAEEVVEIIESGGEGISRRALLAGAGGVAGVAALSAAATPLASLGPRLHGIHTTPWPRGVRSRSTAPPPMSPRAPARRSPAPATTRPSLPGREGDCCSARQDEHCPSFR